MPTKNRSGFLALGIFLTVVCASAYAQAIPAFDYELGVIVLPIIATWALWGLFLVARNASEACEDTE